MGTGAGRLRYAVLSRYDALPEEPPPLVRGRFRRVPSDCSPRVIGRLRRVMGRFWRAVDTGSPLRIGRFRRAVDTGSPLRIGRFRRAVDTGSPFRIGRFRRAVDAWSTAGRVRGRLRKVMGRFWSGGDAWPARVIGRLRRPSAAWPPAGLLRPVLKRRALVSSSSSLAVERWAGIQICCSVCPDFFAQDSKRGNQERSISRRTRRNTVSGTSLWCSIWWALINSAPILPQNRPVWRAGAGLAAAGRRALLISLTRYTGSLLKYSTLVPAFR